MRVRCTSTVRTLMPSSKAFPLFAGPATPQGPDAGLLSRRPPLLHCLFCSQNIALAAEGMPKPPEPCLQLLVIPNLPVSA